MTVKRATSRSALDDVSASADALEAAYDRRAETIIAARARGQTWRAIADAARMTQHGARLTVENFRRRRASGD